MPDHHDERPPTAPEADWEAIARCLADESNPVEFAHVRAWLVAHPVDAVLVEAVKARTAHAEARADVTVDIEAALAAVRTRLAADAAGP